MTNIISLPAPMSRISAKVRQAVRPMAYDGLAQNTAAVMAGLSRQGPCKALMRLNELALAK